MVTRVISLILMTITLFGCSRHAPEQQTTAPIVKSSTTQVRSLPAFNLIYAEGRINVDLHTGYSKPQVILRGDPRDLQQIVTRVQGGRLVFSLGDGYPRYGAVTAEVRTRYLNSFTYRGAGSITGSRIQSGLLDLSIENPGNTSLAGNINLRKLEVLGPGQVTINGVNTRMLILTMRGKPKVQLIGVANLAQLNLAGDGWFSLYWVKSDSLTIKAKDKIFLQLAGITNRLEVELWGHAQFKGRYLRANRAFVKTHDYSVAEMSAIKRQHTLATDASDIYFYNIPDMKQDFMAYNGAVLDMRDWEVFALEEYTRYNKNTGV